VQRTQPADLTPDEQAPGANHVEQPDERYIIHRPDERDTSDRLDNLERRHARWEGIWIGFGAALALISGLVFIILGILNSLLERIGN
jgi:hypothetical protein